MALCLLRQLPESRLSVLVKEGEREAAELSRLLDARCVAAVSDDLLAVVAAV